MEIKEPIGYNPVKVIIILVVVVVVLLGLLFFFAQNSCSTSKDLGYIKGKLEVDLAGIKNDIGKSNTIVNTLLEGQKKFDKALYGDEKEEGVLQKLDKSLKQNDELEKKLDQRPKPEDPETFQDLKQCKTKYEELSESYNLCLDLNRSKDETLKLFGTVKKNLISQLSLLKGAVSELKGQVKNFTEIEKKVKESMDSLDKVYRNNRFWGAVKNVGIGSIAGALAVLILKVVLK